jgi:hypothetical protein
VAPLNAGENRTVRTSAFTWSVIAVVFVECLSALWTASRGYFLQDDFLDLQRVRQLGFGGRLFEHPVFGHFVPGFTVIDYLLSLIVPYQWWSVVLIDVLLFAASLILLHRLLTTLFSSSWLGVALVAVAGASFSLVPSFVWWSTALEYLVAIPASLVVIRLDHRLAPAKEWFGVVSYRSATGAVATQTNGLTIAIPKAHGTLITPLPPAPWTGSN